VVRASRLRRFTVRLRISDTITRRNTIGEKLQAVRTHHKIGFAQFPRIKGKHLYDRNLEYGYHSSNAFSLRDVGKGW
jgi:hypothetical protein